MRQTLAVAEPPRIQLRPEKQTVLVVDASGESQVHAAPPLLLSGCECVTATSVEAALVHLERVRPLMTLVDARIFDTYPGEEPLGCLRSHRGHVDAVVLRGSRGLSDSAGLERLRGVGSLSEARGLLLVPSGSVAPGNLRAGVELMDPGGIFLRGKVVPVVDLAMKFGLPHRPVTKWSCIVIVEADMEGQRTRCWSWRRETSSPPPRSARACGWSSSMGWGARSAASCCC